MAQLNFDSTGVPAQSSFDPIPAGWYNVSIVSSEYKDTSSGGKMLNLQVKVLDGQYANRIIFDGLNLVNQNPVAEKIAAERLSAYCAATGVIRFQDTNQLHGIPFSVRVAIKIDRTGQYDPSNKVSGVRPLSTGVPQMGGYIQPGAQQYVQPAAPQYPMPPAAVQPTAQPAIQPAYTPTAQPAPPAVPQPVAPQLAMAQPAALLVMQPMEQSTVPPAPTSNKPVPPWGRG